MADEEVLEVCINEGHLHGIFHGYRNRDTVFKMQGGASWMQDEYLYEHHYLHSPRAKIIKLTDKATHKETFYMEVEGIKGRVRVRLAYL